MIKKFQIELLILGFLIFSIFVFYNIDMGLFNLFNKFGNSLQNTYLKESFTQITILGDSKWYFFISILLILTYFFLNG